MAEENHKRIRGRKLQRIRQAVLRAEPRCVECLEKGRFILATEVDHIIPLKDGGEETPENRQGLCASCHQEKTAKDMGYTPRPEIGIDGWPVEK